MSKDVKHEEEKDIKEEQKDEKETSTRTYTDEEVNAISLKNEQKAINKLLESMGLSSVEEAQNLAKKQNEEISEAKEKSVEEENKKEQLEEQIEEETEVVETEQPKEKENKVDLEEIAKKAVSELTDLKIQNGMLLKGINASKAPRLAKLIERNNILNEQGQVDEDKLNTEIETVLKIFPELVKNEDQQVGFKVGADGTEELKKNPLDDIKKAMGIKE